MLTIRIYGYRILEIMFTNHRYSKHSDEDTLTNRAYG